MNAFKTGVLFCWAAAVLVLVAAPASADWFLGDSHKMHFPQLPDPFGWDVEISSLDIQHECADDWRCSASGPVSDIHFWYSVNIDAPTQIGTVVTTIYSDDRTGQYSKPGAVLWTQAFTAPNFTVINGYGSGLQGFADPQYPETWLTGIENHMLFHQINIRNIENPFIQTEGEIYWLGIYVFWPDSQEPVGWKTSLNHFEDAAVFRDLATYEWLPLTQEYGAPYRMDFAFVITPEPSSVVLLAVAMAALLVFRRFEKD